MRQGRIRKSGKPADTTGIASTLALRLAVAETAGYTVDDARLARQARLDALSAVDSDGNPDHAIRLRAADGLDEVVMPKAHGNAGGQQAPVVNVLFAPWMRKPPQS